MVYCYGSDLWKVAYNQGKIHGDAYQTIAGKEIGLSSFPEKEILRYCHWARQRFFYRPRYLTHLFAKALKTDDYRWAHSVMDELVAPLHRHTIMKEDAE